MICDLVEEAIEERVSGGTHRQMMVGLSWVPYMAELGGAPEAEETLIAQASPRLSLSDQERIEALEILAQACGIMDLYEGIPGTTATLNPPPENLANATQANLWVYLSQDPDLSEYLSVKAAPAFDVDAFDLDVFVDGSEYCNPNRMYADEGTYEMSCEFEEKTHTSVQRVSGQTRNLGDLRCEKNFQSSNRVTIFACAWR